MNFTTFLLTIIYNDATSESSTFINIHKTLLLWFAFIIPGVTQLSWCLSRRLSHMVAWSLRVQNNWLEQHSCQHNDVAFGQHRSVKTVYPESSLYSYIYDFRKSAYCRARSQNNPQPSCLEYYSNTIGSKKIM